MQIAVVGAGRIGTTFGFHLAKAGHHLTLIARGQRLEALQRERAITTVDNQRVAVDAAATLAADTPWDLVVVTVLASQVDAVLPQLAQSRAKLVLFAFNTFASLDPLRDAVGAERFAFGFPQMMAFFIDGKLKSRVSGPGMVTVTNSAAVCEILKTAGLPTALAPDMESYLRSHAAFVIPMMLAGHLAYQRSGGIAWAEARQIARATREAFAVVRYLGNTITPGFVVMLAKLPQWLFAFVLWASSRSSAVRDLGSFGDGELRSLIDAVVERAPDRTHTLRSLRP